ncbi:dTDP-4-amino-4,6-dideoxygalactose transaminase [Hydrogenovibrio kuenenii]|uniref:dTDP-4-amino-4,6-dideoxygalactose transaminase n=1 Tax=Hydrogenovibrio kuenenii TaxID=63658 RepID=UPI00046397AA|nr:dTDP-4-amino-4,6-dideoxygalactose transaminase [Hydrogenovibrio kuenenii]
MIKFNVPPFTGKEQEYVIEAINSQKLCGDGEFSRRCQGWFEERFSFKKTLLTPSCTHALEMAALLLDVGPEDEVILPSFTFVSTANAFVLRGASIVYVDICPKTMNINPEMIEAAITDKTKAIVVVHYGGVACDMDRIMVLAEEKGVYVVEDAAQAMMCSYKGKFLGGIGHLAAFSFHETKNYTSGGEGGLLVINDDRFIERSEIIREKGTNRKQFFRGQVDKYTWVDIGSSYLPSELQAAFLLAQLESADEINDNRLNIWKGYYSSLERLQESGLLELPLIPEGCAHNAHLFYLKLEDMEQRSNFIQFMASNNITTPFHYVPLHSSPAGSRFGRFHGVDRFTTSESNRLVRLPMYFGLRQEDLETVVDSVGHFFNS